MQKLVPATATTTIALWLTKKESAFSCCHCPSSSIHVSHVWWYQQLLPCSYTATHDFLDTHSLTQQQFFNALSLHNKQFWNSFAINLECNATTFLHSTIVISQNSSAFFTEETSADMATGSPKKKRPVIDSHVSSV
jgi:hypothetical protein